MSATELEAWFLNEPLVLAYGLFLLIGSLVSFVVLSIRIARANRLGPVSVSEWPLKTLDFMIFMVALLLWFILSGAILLRVHDWLNGREAEIGAGLTVLGGFFLQAGMLYLFFRFRFHFRSPNEGPLSPRIVPLGNSLFLGLFYFLASLPVVYGVSTLWAGLIELLRANGWDIELPLQDAVTLLRETDSVLAFLGLITLAVVVAPIVEETVFRGGIYRFLKGRMSIFFALLLSASLFGMVHGNMLSLPGLITVGICLGVAYEVSGSLRVPIFFHAFFNLNSIIWILILPENLPV